jgi:N,N-dimethylformamidase
MVLIDYPNDGAVCTVGSITWCACLAYNAYHNTVAKVAAGNVLNRF